MTFGGSVEIISSVLVKEPQAESRPHAKLRHSARTPEPKPRLMTFRPSIVPLKTVPKALFEPDCRQDGRLAATNAGNMVFFCPFWLGLSAPGRAPSRAGERPTRGQSHMSLCGA